MLLSIRFANRASNIQLPCILAGVEAEFADRLLVADSQIHEVLDLVTGKLAPAESLVTADRQQVLQLRMRLAEDIEAGRPRHARPLCAVPVRLVRREKKDRFFSRHDLEDGRCPVRTALRERFGSRGIKRRVTPARDFDHDSAYDELVAFLFPEIADKLRTTPW